MTRGGQDSPIRQKHGRAGAVALYGRFELILTKGLEEAPRGLVPICLHNLEQIWNILDGALFDHGVGNLEERSDVRAILQVLRVAVPR